MTTGNLGLRKFASNSEDVMLALSPDDLAKDLKDLDFDSNHLPLQRSLEYTGIYRPIRSPSVFLPVRNRILSEGYYLHSVNDPL